MSVAPPRPLLAEAPSASRAAVRIAATAVAPSLAVDPPWERLLPAGLPRGQLVSVVGATSVALGLIARASRDGVWCVAVGIEDLGLAAAEELGVALRRLALVPTPGRRWTDVVAVALEAFGVVVVRWPSGLSSTVARRLQARARQRGAVLLALTDAGATAVTGAHLDLRVVTQRWQGPEEGAGHLRRRHLIVRVAGRGAAARPRDVEVAWRPV